MDQEPEQCARKAFAVDPGSMYELGRYWSRLPKDREVFDYGKRYAIGAAQAGPEVGPPDGGLDYPEGAILCPLEFEGDWAGEIEAAEEPGCECVHFIIWLGDADGCVPHWP